MQQEMNTSSVRHLDLIKNAIFGSKLQITLSILTEALIVPQWIADLKLRSNDSYNFYLGLCYFYEMALKH